MKVSENLYFSEKGFLFDPATGLTYSLNKTGAFIFQRLRQGLDASEITEALINKYGIDPKMARDDLRDFIQQLNDFGLGVAEGKK